MALSKKLRMVRRGVALNPMGGEVITKIEEERVSFETLIEEEETEEAKEDYFDINKALKDIYNNEDCIHIYLDPNSQKQMELEVGINVSHEHPWRQIKYRDFLEKLYASLQDASIEIRDQIRGIGPNEYILVGYAPSLANEDDDPEKGEPFVILASPEAILEASHIIEQIEAYENYILNKALVKRGRGWFSMGSEKEVELGIKPEREKLVDVEVQSVYPMYPGKAPLEMRTTSDIRDGYIELVPENKKYYNLQRKRVDIAIQSAAMRVNLEQQTDPTFPTNAWSQYLYEINEGEEAIEESEEEKSQRTRTPTPRSTPLQKPPRPPKEMSDQVNHLLNILELNQIDMYRNDYELIATKELPEYESPYLEECLNFTNMEKSLNRLICALDWYPKTSGLITIAYAFTTPISGVRLSDTTDIISRITSEPNPVLLWSLDNSISFKLEFIAPREVTALSYCPYDPRILIGGTVSGQVIIWDLGNRISNLDRMEVLSAAQEKYREMIQSLLSWSKSINEDRVVTPAALSNIEQGQHGAIIGIKWMDRNFLIKKNGRIARSDAKMNRFFMTASTDGSVAFWNLDCEIEQKKRIEATKSSIPPSLLKEVSEFRKLDRLFKPEYMLIAPEPIVQFLADEALFEHAFHVDDNIKDITVKIPIKVVSKPRKDMKQQLLTVSAFGSVNSYNWQGLDKDTISHQVNKENLSAPFEKFVKVHNGPVFHVERNPFYYNLIFTIGGTVLAIWIDDFPYSPLYWRSRPADLVSAKWSCDKPSILFVTRDDGVLEIWSLLDDTKQATLEEVLGGGIITSVTEHILDAPKKLLGFGDYNSSFRVISLPPAFYMTDVNEKKELTTFIEKELNRKKDVKGWEDAWLEKNADIREARRLAAEAEKRERELHEKLAKEDAIRRARIEAEMARKAALAEKRKLVFDLPQKLEKKWDEMLLKRLVEVLMEKKNVNSAKLQKETAIEKYRINYEKNKKVAIKKSFFRMDEEVSEIRARLLPYEKDDVKREDVIKTSVSTMIVEDQYSIIEQRSNKSIEEGEDECVEQTLNEIIERGKQRRVILDAAQGGNTKRQEYISELSKEDEKLSDLVYDYDRFLKIPEVDIETIQQSVEEQEVFMELDDAEISPEIQEV